ncbi:MAG: glycosyltransferase family 39 protein [Candidatus Yanofskybacteria bacterium]|nr:glycosyltransferase family 39 protein [Candidatus Yanofskybacteria bacterium]
MKSDHKTKLLAGLIISVAVILAVTSSWNDSLIVDEIPHIGAGYSYLVKQDMRLNPEHPPLVKDLAAIPLLFLKLKQDVFDTKSWQNDLNGQWEFGRKLIFNSGNNANQITHLVKQPMLLFFILSAILIFRWTKKLYGNKAGLTALILFSFSPTVLAHSRFVTTDIPALFGILYATYFFFRYLKNQTAKNFWLASIFLGIALLTKFSTFMLIPFFFGLALIYAFISQKNHLKLPAHSILLAVTAFVIVVMPVYAFHTWNYLPERQYSDTNQTLETFGNRLLADPIVWASDKPVLRIAAQYGLGLLMVTQRSVGGNTTYFLGEVSRFGWRHYFPIVYLIKEPLAWWGLLTIALISAIVQFSIFNFQFLNFKNWVKNNFTETAMILWLVFYWALSINSTLNIGVRHLLPTYPFAIILVSGQLERISYKLQVTSYKFKKLLITHNLLLITLLGWYIFENLSVSPYYLTYFNQTVGGPSGGYRYVVDSNLDWGQDLKRFSDWVKENNIPKIEFDYFGWADPYYYLGIKYEALNGTKYLNAEDFAARNQTDGWLAVSASFLQSSQGPPDQYKSVNYIWLQNHTPVTAIGNSIFVYRLTY